MPKLTVRVLCSPLRGTFKSYEYFANSDTAIEYNMKVHITGKVTKDDLPQLLTDYQQMQGLTPSTSQLQGYQGYDNPSIPEETAGVGGGVERY